MAIAIPQFSERSSHGALAILLSVSITRIQLCRQFCTFMRGIQCATQGNHAQGLLHPLQQCYFLTFVLPSVLVSTYFAHWVSGSQGKSKNVVIYDGFWESVYGAAQYSPRFCGFRISWKLGHFCGGLYFRCCFECCLHLHNIIFTSWLYLLQFKGLKVLQRQVW